MNKTISINLGGRNFFIEEEAYLKLNTYLNGIKNHFNSYKGSEEIVSDMEARIAEKFLEKFEIQSQSVITLNHVESLISEIGSIEDLSKEENGEQGSNEKKESIPASKRLMRNGDDKIIAGVASGLAAYFGADPIIFRLIFVILLLAGGSIIPIYLVLWIIMPEAKTTTEKMQMRGEPFNIDSIGQTIKERAGEFKEHINNISSNEETKKKVNNIKNEFSEVGQKSYSSITNFFRSFFNVVGKVINFIFKFITKFIGIIFIFAISVAILSLTFATAIALFNSNSPYIGFPLNILSHNPEYYIILIIAYIILLVPLKFLLLLGISILNNKKNISLRLSLIILGLWVVALISGGVLAVKYGPDYVEQIKNSNELKQTTKSFEVKEFKNLILANSNSYKLIQGENFSVKAEGTAVSLENLNVQINKDTLQISQNNKHYFCIFCFSKRANIEITAPEFKNITAKNSVTVHSELITSSSTTLTLSNASKANIKFLAENLDLNLSNASKANLSGVTKNLNAKLSNSSKLEASELVSQTTEIHASNASKATVNVYEKIIYEIKNSSKIFYYGNPIVQGEENTALYPVEPLEPLEPINIQE